VVSEQVVDGLLVGGEMGGNVHVVQYVGRLLAQAPAFGGDKPASFSSRRSSTLLEDVKGKSATKTN